MNRSEAKEEIKKRYAEYMKPAKKRNTYICPKCGNGTGKDGDGITLNPKSKDGLSFHCFKCDFNGDVIAYYQEENNCDYKEAFNALCDYFGIDIDETTHNTAVKSTKEHKPIKTHQDDKGANMGQISPNESIKDFTEYYKKCREDISDPAAQEYLAFRGISNDTAAAYYIGYDKKTRHLIIPSAKSYYAARNTDRSAERRFSNPTGAKIELFNKKALYNKELRPVFITEGAIDALSIIEVGGEAVATHSTSNYHKIIEALKEQPTNNMLVLCFDNDTAGKDATKELAEGLNELAIPFIEADITGTHKDPNEALTADKEAFKKAVIDAENKAIEKEKQDRKPDNSSDYIKNLMSLEVEQLKAQSDRKTGFKNLDAEAGSIYAGLYAIGGISSVGKTTFISQIADQMAAQGQHVLFFSMEQSRLEMVSKSIARQTAKLNPQNAVSSLQIRTGLKNEVISKAAAEYMESVGDRISVIEGNFNCDVSFIRDYVRRYSEKNGGVKPVIIIDYLQVLQGEVDEKTGRRPTDIRQIVDHNVTELKRMSREGITVFVISSVNRSNYLAPIDFESFKESGGIEYTADVVWGLQLAAIHNEVFDSDKKIKEKREVIATAKAAIPREIELVCIKNRYGKSRYTAQFTYYPQYDFFEPVLHDEFMPCREKTPFDNARVI